MTKHELRPDDETPSDVPNDWRPVLWGAARIIHSQSAVGIAQSRVLPEGTTGDVVIDHGDNMWGFRPDGSNGAVSMRASDLGPVEENKE